jgi:hypothetical protein
MTQGARAFIDEAARDKGAQRLPHRRHGGRNPDRMPE